MTKNDVIAAAFEVWGREVYKTTSLSMLAKALGVSKAALYRHFPSKEALLAAMRDTFCDDYARVLKEALGKAKEAGDKKERLLVVVQALSRYFAGNWPYFVFCLFSLNKLNMEKASLRQFIAEMEKRDVFFPAFTAGFPKDKEHPDPMFLVSMFSLFQTALFHKSCFEKRGMANAPAEEEVEQYAISAVERVRRGLGFEKAAIDAVSCERLEKLVSSEFDFAAIPPDPLLKAVAETVAAAGPWNASMEAVAGLSGLSKSGLYAHFKSKEDMLSRLFMTEFDRIAAIAEACSAHSPRWEERLYLVISSISAYLMERPDILTALDWVRIQRMELDIAVPSRLADFFAGLNLAVDSGISSKDVSRWSLFLIVAVLIQYSRANAGQALPSGILRKMFRFITLGINGFNQDMGECIKNTDECAKNNEKNT
ncbi:MAG: TetR/AcrR family transcriptional regulator [Treponema sp.]|jgi:AcrR family transcriptional regulator|nr:TetR/AcrR family transcriptional regulator [Treponema sp.]